MAASALGLAGTPKAVSPAPWRPPSRCFHLLALRLEPLRQLWCR